MRFSGREAKGTHREMGQGDSRVAAMCHVQVRRDQGPDGAGQKAP